MIYVDMDGVLVQPDSDDFSRRSWAPGGRELWRAVAAQPVRLLSWGTTHAYHRVLQQKLEWVRRELGSEHVADVIILPDVHKAHFCNPGDVLIDDAVKHRAMWESRGGKFILHASAASSIAALPRLTVDQRVDLRLRCASLVALLDDLDLKDLTQ